MNGCGSVENKRRRKQETRRAFILADWNNKEKKRKKKKEKTQANKSELSYTHNNKTTSVKFITTSLIGYWLFSKLFEYLSLICIKCINK